MGLTAKQVDNAKPQGKPYKGSRHFYMFSIAGVFGENGEYFLIFP